MQASVPAVSSYSGQTSYGYDALGQLLSEQSQRAGGFTNTFAYDAAQNPTTFRGATFSFNSDNQNTAIIDSLASGANEPLTAYPDGVIADGNTRIRILMNRGVDVNSLPRVLRERTYYPNP